MTITNQLARIEETNLGWETAVLEMLPVCANACSVAKTGGAPTESYCKIGFSDRRKHRVYAGEIARRVHSALQDRHGWSFHKHVRRIQF